MDELTSVYVQECREQLAEMEAGLLRLEQVPDDHDNINAIFRAAHTIKGGSGVWGPVPMPANPQVNDADAKKLVAWILAQK